jgi:hypothetical protein
MDVHGRRDLQVVLCRYATLRHRELVERHVDPSRFSKGVSVVHTDLVLEFRLVGELLRVYPGRLSA